MAEIGMFTFTTEKLQGFANDVKDGLLTHLEGEGLLKNKAEQIAGEHIVLLHQKGCFGRIIDKMLGCSDDGTRLIIVHNPEIAKTTTGKGK